MNTLIGTPYAGFAEEIHGGGTLPAVGLPYAMTNFQPQRCENNIGNNAYKYEDKTTMGFLAKMSEYGQYYSALMTRCTRVIPIPVILKWAPRPIKAGNRGWNVYSLSP